MRERLSLKARVYFDRLIGWTTTVAATSRLTVEAAAVEASGYLPNRRAGSDPSRYILSLCQGEG